MHILICHERFLFRYGADRLFLILARAFREKGHQVTLLGNRYDPEVVKTVADRTVFLPNPPDADWNDFTRDWLKSNWDSLFAGTSFPDVVVNGGWPFFSAMPFLRQRCFATIFSDLGAVPMEGMPEAILPTLAHLRLLRRRYLSNAASIVSLSNFIATSQSLPDCSQQVPIRSILAGADHMESSFWTGSLLSDARKSNLDLSLVQRLRQEGHFLVLSLGRWEESGYKNSKTAFNFIRQFMAQTRRPISLLVTASPDLPLPDDLKKTVIPVGFPDDAELNRIMRLVDLGVCFSLWEGFNLPLAEMQWLGKETLVFDVGAHPEVVCHPWYLCQDIQEMTGKAMAILSGHGLDLPTREASICRFRSHFTWKRAVDEYLGLFSELLSRAATSRLPQGEARFLDKSVIVDVTNSCRDPANSGVIRVTRRLCRSLQQFCEPIFAVWQSEHERYVLPTKAEFEFLSQFNGPRLAHPKYLSPDTKRVPLAEFIDAERLKNSWLVLTETVQETNAVRIRDFCAQNQIRTAAVFHDAIALTHAELCNEDVTSNHAAYMEGLSKLDVILPNSEFSAHCLRAFWKDRCMSGAEVVANPLPGEFGGKERARIPSDSDSNQIQMLCVSTLEPRKNHRRLVQACLQLEELRPSLNWKLTLVGNRYAGASDLASEIEQVAKTNPRIEWLGIVDDDGLAKLYSQCSLTVYASFVEGFAMPIMESMWFGKPCVCHNGGVMAELAAGGGCLTADVLDVHALRDAILRLSTDKQLHRALSHQAVSRPIKSWHDYTVQFLRTLESMECRDTHKNHMMEVLYPHCLCDHWQMNDSERLAMTAILARHKPRCSVEVGTYKGGSLSLISQFSEWVFSIDIDPTIPEQFKNFGNVSFLTGQSAVVLPLLMEEMNRVGDPIDFILIDGDHTAEGVQRDIECVLHYRPRKPMFVVLHDSFNPTCRKGILAVDWGLSPYVHWVDVDFVPGRIVEHGGGGDGEAWGGLAVAYVLPAQRSFALNTLTSANNMFLRLTAEPASLINGGVNVQAPNRPSR